jgi:hypothetical protein
MLKKDLSLWVLWLLLAHSVICVSAGCGSNGCNAGQYCSGNCVDCSAGRYTSTSNQNSCTACNAGKSSSSGSTSCTDCTAGKASTSGGPCTICSAGTVSAAGAASCSNCDPGTSSTAGSGSCVDCTAGKYSTSGGLCTDCSPGFFSATKSSTCTVCSVGSFQDASAMSYCDNCPVGTFQNKTGMSFCSSCPQGTFMNSTGYSYCFGCPPGRTGLGLNGLISSSGCTACLAGTYSTGTAVPCTDCSPGYKSSVQASSCDACVTGSYSAVSQADRCIFCPIGNFQDLTAQTSCKLCDPGKYRNTQGNANCLSCDAGQYVSTSGSTTCDVCVAGSYQPVTSQSSCFLCPDGWSTNGTSGSVNCTQCKKGWFAVSGTPSCQPCQSGLFSIQTNVSSCLSCYPGSFSLSNSTSCTYCSPGYYSNATASSFCTSCEPGRYSNRTNQTVCVICKGGYHAGANSTVCSQCDQGTYSLDEAPVCSFCPIGHFMNASFQTYCYSCPTLSTTRFTKSADRKDCLCLEDYYGNPGRYIPCKVCQKEIPSITCPLGTIEPYIGYGYFRDPIDPGKPVQCLPPYACQLTGNLNVTPCTSGYTGYACGSCIQYVSYRSGFTCRFCPSAVSRTATYTAIILVLIALIIWMMFSKQGTPPDIKVLLQALQTIGLYPRISINWPENFLGLTTVLSLTSINLDLFAPDCTVNVGFWVKYYVKMCFPVIIGSGAMLTYYPAKYVLSLCKNPNVDLHGKLIDKMIPLSVALLSGLYTLLISAAFDPFHCKLRSGDVFVLANEPSFECYGEEWTKRLPSTVSFAFIYAVILPAVLGWLLFKHRNDLNSSRVQTRYGVLYLYYRGRCYWWEIVLMLKRVSPPFSTAGLTLLKALFFIALEFAGDVQKSQTKVFLCISFMIGFIGIHMVVNPFILQSRNSLSVV